MFSLLAFFFFFPIKMSISYEQSASKYWVSDKCVLTYLFGKLCLLRVMELKILNLELETQEEWKCFEFT